MSLREVNLTHWTTWSGADYCPTDPNDRVIVRRRDGTETEGLACSFAWTRTPVVLDRDIVKYKVLAVKVDDQTKEEYSGGNTNYYRVLIDSPKSGDPSYTAEAEDIIEALGMTFAEGCAFKAIWRSCAARTLNINKRGYGKDGPKYDAEKVVYYGGRMLQAALRKLKGAK